jgi:hypothetical protein
VVVVNDVGWLESVAASVDERELAAWGRSIEEWGDAIKAHRAAIAACRIPDRIVTAIMGLALAVTVLLPWGHLAVSIAWIVSGAASLWGIRYWIRVRRARRAMEAAGREADACMARALRFDA